MNTKKFVVSFIFGLATLLVATAASAAGSAQAGSAKSLFCAACHGLDGNIAYASTPLAGQPTARFHENMVAYKAGRRLHPVMNILSFGLSEQDIQDLAMYYATQKPLNLEHASLYWRLGGPDAVNAVVEELIKVAKADERLSSRAVGDCAPKLKELLCEATGGPCTYTGRDMKTAHSGLNITEVEFDAVAENLVKILDTFQVAEQEKNDLVGLIVTMRGDIVGQ